MTPDHPHKKEGKEATFRTLTFEWLEGKRGYVCMGFLPKLKDDTKWK